MLYIGFIRQFFIYDIIDLFVCCLAFSQQSLMIFILIFGEVNMKFWLLL